MKVIICTFGTRGDVQPFVGLSVALKAAGHHPIIATSPTFKTWIEQYGIEWADLNTPDPKAAFSVCVAKGFFTLKFLRTVRALFSPMIRDVGLTLVKLVQDQKPDLVCCTFSTIYCGIHIKEKFNIPCAILSYVPVGPTKYFFSSYAHRFFQASAVKSAKRNLYSHKLIDYMYGRLTQPMMGQFRKEIGLPNIKGFSEWTALKEAPVLTCYSPALLPPPPDWPTTHRQVGYWWLPPTDLETLDVRTKKTMAALRTFIAAGDKPIYIGFGSVPISEPGQVERITKMVLETIRLSGQRAIIATGWGAIELPSTIDTPRGSAMAAADTPALADVHHTPADLTQTQRNSANATAAAHEAKTDEDTDSEGPSPTEEHTLERKPSGHHELVVPDNCFVLDAIPHDWMFTDDKLKVIVHHGGAGTTGAALKAGVPAVICPFFGDHFLWSQRLYEIGAGAKPLPHDRLSAPKLASRIKDCVNNKQMHIEVRKIAQSIALEDGLTDGVRAMEELVANGGHWATSRVTHSTLAKPIASSQTTSTAVPSTNDVQRIAAQ